MRARLRRLHLKIWKEGERFDPAKLKQQAACTRARSLQRHIENLSCSSPRYKGIQRLRRNTGIEYRVRKIVSYSPF